MGLPLEFLNFEFDGWGGSQRVGPRIRAASPKWQIRARDDGMGICFGQLRLARLYSYDYTRVYPEIVVVTPR
jgi:hypothetical protein